MRSPNTSGLMTPDGAIMHYTAGYTAASAIASLTKPEAKVSAHLVIDRDGKITQLVPFNRVAWHAGPSAYAGRQGCNNFTVGFEFVNPGYFKIGKAGEIIDAYGTVLSAKKQAEFDLTVRAPDKRIGGGTFIWPGYTEAQIAAGLAALAAIHKEYGLDFVTGHEDIDTRKWKTDPGDAFPMGDFKAIIHGAEEAANGRSAGATPLKSKMLVGTARLNCRAEASPSGRVIAQLSGGSEVVVIADLGAWSLVEYAPGHRGYVADQFLKAA